MGDPTQIGPYNIESSLREGGLSNLYLGINAAGEPVAIKTLSQRYIGNKEVEDLFSNERSVLAQLNHASVVKYISEGTWENGPYLAMEYIAGPSLRQLILKNAFSLAGALEIVLQMADALGYLHSQKIIHCDLKPENILIAPDNTPKIIDFGIARSPNKTDVDHHLIAKGLIGTPTYMSPERKEGGAAISYSSDIYSLAIITYELVLGKLCHGVIHLSLMPRSIQRILAKALQAEPENRYLAVADFAADIQGYLSSPAFEKDSTSGNSPRYVAERLYQAQIRLLPSHQTAFPHLKIGIINHREIHFSGIYHDFFELQDSNYACALVEAPTYDADGVVYMAVLRGMIRSLAPLAASGENFLLLLNELLHKDPIRQQFTMCYLQLYPKEKEYHFYSFGRLKLWRMPFGDAKPESIEGTNPKIGALALIDDLQVIKGAWNIGDRIILHNKELLKAPKAITNGLSEDEFCQALIETCRLDPQRQVETIFRKASKLASRSASMNATCVISIERTV